MEDLLSEFLTETRESLAQLEVALVQLEQDPNDRTILSSIFRCVHTIKGTCGFLGLARLEKVAHAAENVLGKYRDGTVGVTPASITLILHASDAIKEIVSTIESTGGEAPGDDSAIIAELNAAADGTQNALSPSACEGVAEAPEKPALDAATAQPAAAESPAAAAEPAVAVVHEDAPERRAADRRKTPDRRILDRAETQAEPAGQTIRVSVDVLEGLMTLVGELVLTRNQILQLARAQEYSIFAGPLQRLSHITSELQEGMMKARMQPIGNAWSNLPRLVRDLSHELGKKIELSMIGAETELDRQVLELIKDPLTHMVRNSGDHGLETVAERRAAGKLETGRITLNAFHEGGQIIIEVGDDGRGLPADRIRAKIIANGLATQSELGGMTDQQIQQFIFRPGFSTATAVTSVSGRGVGMDVVKTNIERIGGTIDLTSVPGRGTTFTIKIPLTLAIVSALIVEVSSERFAIPQISVVELVRAEADVSADTGDEPGQESVIEQINDTPVLRLRDQLLPLVDLGDFLQLRDAGNPEAAPRVGAGERGGSVYIVVTQVGSSRFGLIVDRVFDTEEIVVKPIAPILRHIAVFSGNTILGDGSVIMILDPNGIARGTGIGAGAATEPGGGSPMINAHRSSEKMGLLIFRANDAAPKAVPLSLISRLEDIERNAIEFSDGAPLTQYRGKLMPLVGLGQANDGGAASGRTRQPVLVFADGDRAMGLMVDEIVDVVEDHLHIELSGERSGFLGTAIVGGRATDILDTGFWLKQAFKDWPGGKPDGRAARPEILVVEDSPFFRNLIIPPLSAANYVVTAGEGPVAALRLRDAGKPFDLILSDIEMPDMDGFAFANTVRRGGIWAALPMLAFTGRERVDDTERALAAGFDALISKYDQSTLLETIAATLTSRRADSIPGQAGNVWELQS